MAAEKRQYYGVKRFHRDGEQGQALVETALTLPLLLALIVGATELARVAYMSIEVANAAEAAAVYGSQNGGTAVDFDNSSQGTNAGGMQLKAQQDASDLYKSGTATNFTTTVTTVCQCEPKTSGVTPTTVSCTDNTTCTAANLQMETILSVATSATFDPLIHVPGLPSAYTLHGLAVQKVLNN
jgi:Flp pilus assembly protein TadG